MNTRIIALFSIVILSFILLNNSALAFDLDETVDDEIRKNYNTQEENLPALPAITKHMEASKKADVKVSTPPKQTITYPVYKGGNTKLKKGTVFSVASSNAISDWQSAGTNVKFVSKQPVYIKNVSIPQGTVFNGEIIESHQPQITCNGGLVVIRVHSMIYKGQTVPISAYVIRANDKKIFLNNIKGERTYLKTMWKKGNWGRTLFNRMMTLTVNLGGDGSTFILSPFPLAYGTICLGMNAITSPFCAFFSKGGHVSIPAGKMFKIKILEDTMI